MAAAGNVPKKRTRSTNRALGSTSATVTGAATWARPGRPPTLPPRRRPAAAAAPPRCATAADQRHGLKDGKLDRQRGDRHRQRHTSGLGDGSRDTVQPWAQTRPQQDQPERGRNTELQAEVEQHRRVRQRHQHGRHEQAGERVGHTTDEHGHAGEADHDPRAHRRWVAPGEQRVADDAHHHRHGGGVGAEQPPHQAARERGQEQCL